MHRVHSEDSCASCAAVPTGAAAPMTAIAAPTACANVILVITAFLWTKIERSVAPFVHARCRFERHILPRLTATSSLPDVPGAGRRGPLRKVPGLLISFAAWRVI